MSTPNLSIPYVPEGTLDPAAGLNLALNFIDAVLQSAVISMDLTAPPGSPSDGDLYIVGFSATGAWAGHDRDLARYVAEGDSWQFFEAGVEVFYVLNRDDGGFYKFVDGSPVANWTLAAGLSDAPSDGNAYGRKDGAWEQVPDVAAMGNATVLTEGDESVAFPNSRQLLVDATLVADDTVAGERTLGVAAALARAALFAPNHEWRLNGSAALGAYGAAAAVLVGSASSPSKTTGGTVAGYMGARRQASTTAANNVASFRSADALDSAYAGSSGATWAAGLRLVMRFATGAVVAGERFFAGMAPSAAEAGTVDPSSLINCFGVGKDGADGTFHIMHNDGADSATKVDTTVTFAANVALELELYVPRGGGAWTYRLVNLETGTAYTGTIAANIPAADVALHWRLWASVGAASGTAVSVDANYIGLRYPL